MYDKVCYKGENTCLTLCSNTLRSITHYYMCTYLCNVYVHNFNILCSSEIVHIILIIFVLHACHEFM